MNAATIISLCAGTLQLGMGALLLAVSRAPGWRDVRLSASLALVSAAYSATNVIFTVPGWGFEVTDLASRASWLFAALHIATWALIASQTARDRRPYEIVAVVTALVGAIGMIPGLYQEPVVRVVHVPWARVTYEVLPTSAVGDVVTVWFLVVLGLPLVRFAREMRAGVPGAAVQTAAFGLYFLCALEEILVNGGFLDFLYLADVGFLVVVAAIATNAIQRVIADAARLDLLATDLASLVARRDRQLGDAGEALLEAERHAALGRLAAGVGHEVNNPLTYLGVALDDLGEWITRSAAPPDVREALGQSRVAYARIRAVVETLRLATRDTEDARRLSLDDVARRALEAAPGVAVEASLASGGYVLGEEPALVRMVTSLVQHAAERGAVRIGLRTWCVGDRVGVDVTDDGPGMADGDRERALTPYFTTHTDHPGLGLFFARNLAARHGGSLTLEPATGGGTLRRVELPRAPIDAPSRTPTPAPAAEALAPPRRARVLVVDDDELVARSLARIVGTRCEARICPSGTDALALLEQDAAWDVILCDLMMPGVSGPEVADTLERTRPGLRRRMVFLTGGATAPASAEFLERPDVVVLRKPIDFADLWRSIDRVIADGP